MTISCKYTSDGVFIKLQPKGQIDLLCDPGATESWVALLQCVVKAEQGGGIDDNG